MSTTIDPAEAETEKCPMRVHVLVLFVFISFATPALAQEASGPSQAYTDCMVAAGTAAEPITACIGTELSRVDGVMVNVYGAAVARASGDALTFLRYGQSAWDKFRTSNCLYYGAAGPAYAEGFCKLEMSWARIAELEAGISYADPLADETI
jgi:uncharacterized protein YecT (DUF1311 family)